MLEHKHKLDIFAEVILPLPEETNSCSPIYLQGTRESLINLAASLAWEKAKYRSSFPSMAEAIALATQLIDDENTKGWRISSACELRVLRDPWEVKPPTLVVSFTNEAEFRPSIRDEHLEVVQRLTAATEG